MKNGLRALLVAQILLTLTLAGFGAATVNAAPPAEQTLQGLQANLDNVELEDFIKFIGKYTGRNIIYRADQIPKTSFNIYSSKPIDEPQLMAIFAELLESVGLQAVSQKDALHILPLAEAKKLMPVLKQGEKAVRGADDEFIVTVYQLSDDIQPALATSLLQGLQSPLGTVQEIPQARAILIRDKRERIQKMLKVMRTVLDVRPEWETKLFKLKQAEAVSVEKMISGMYAEFVKRGRTADAPLLRAVPWANSLFFAGSPEQKKDIEELIAKLDKVEQSTSGFRVYRLQNAKAGAVAEVLTSLVSVLETTATGTGTGESSANSAAKAAAQTRARLKDGAPTLQASADEDTNSVVVIADNEMMVQVENIIQQLDQPQDQVFIEALIMETTLDNARDFGIEWTAGAGGSSVGTIGFVDSDSSNLAGYVDPVYGSTDRAFPDVSSLPGGFSMGILGHLISYDGKYYPSVGALINFAKTSSEINILSTPQIMTLANNEAEIFVGETRPYRTSTQYDANNNPISSYDYREVGIKLKVKPYVNDTSDLIKMEIEQEVESVAEGSISDAPTTLTRNTKTTVQLLDGSTMVISGLMRDDGDKSKTGIPGLADVPVVGWLFKRESRSGTKSTLMVFVTARIVRTLESAQRLTREKMMEAEKARAQAKKHFVKEFEQFPLFNSGDEDEDEGAQAPVPMDDGPVSVTSPGPGAQTDSPAGEEQGAVSND